MKTRLLLVCAAAIGLACKQEPIKEFVARDVGGDASTPREQFQDAYVDAPGPPDAGGDTVAHGDPFADAKARYPGDRMYLTYLALLDLEICLSDPARWQKLSSRAGAKELKGFLTDHKPTRYGLALLYIDLDKLTVGFKTASDRDAGLSTPVPVFAPNAVKAIVVFIDSQLRVVRDAEADLRADTTLNVDGAVTMARKWLDDPLLPPDKAVHILQRVKKAGETDIDGMARLKDQNPKLYDRIRALKSDRQLPQLKRKATLDDWKGGDFSRLKDTSERLMLEGRLTRPPGPP